MKYRALAFAISIAVTSPAFAAAAASAAPDASHKVAFEQVRNATAKITYGGRHF